MSALQPGILCSKNLFPFSPPTQCQRIMFVQLKLFPKIKLIMINVCLFRPLFDYLHICRRRSYRNCHYLSVTAQSFPRLTHVLDSMPSHLLQNFFHQISLIFHRAKQLLICWLIPFNLKKKKKLFHLFFKSLLLIFLQHIVATMSFFSFSSILDFLKQQCLYYLGFFLLLPIYSLSL